LSKHSNIAVTRIIVIKFLKLKIFKQGIRIAEKKQEGITMMVMQTTDSYFDPIKMAMDLCIKIGIYGLHYHPSDPFLFLGLLQRSLFLG